MASWWRIPNYKLMKTDSMSLFEGEKNSMESRHDHLGIDKHLFRYTEQLRSASSILNTVSDCG